MSVIYKWVKRTYCGLHAKKVSELANLGVGYIVLDNGIKDSITVAFKKPVHQIKPDMEVLSEYESNNMELLCKSR